LREASSSCASVRAIKAVTPQAKDRVTTAVVSLA
jgi:hypothetical protein